MTSKLKGTARLRRLKMLEQHPQDAALGERHGKKGQVRTFSEGVPDEVDVKKLRKRLGYR